MDAHANLAISTVATAPVPAASGTSLVVAAGQGALFPAVPFNATVWPVGTIPSTTNAEIVRVTLIVGDTLTITRTQESTSARTIIIGDQIANTITAKVLTDIENVSPSAAAGSPEGSVTRSPGALHIDTTTEDIWIKKTGTGNTGWVQIIMA
jgi:hypothetical protein